MDHRISVASGLIKKGYQKQKVIKFSDTFHSTFYYKSKSTDPQSKPGKPIPGNSINENGTIIPDAFIVNLLTSYREKIVFSNAGGYKTLSKYHSS